MVPTPSQLEFEMTPLPAGPAETIIADDVLAHMSTPTMKNTGHSMARTDNVEFGI